MRADPTPIAADEEKDVSVELRGRRRKFPLSRPSYRRESALAKIFVGVARADG
jgi:hypothetical protein